jgi:hypothetical protein
MDTDVHLSKSVTISAHQWLKRPAAKSSQICTIRIDISTPRLPQPDELPDLSLSSFS